MLFPPILVFLGLANLVYAYLNFQLLKGLRRLEATPPAPPRRLPTVTILIAARDEEDRIRKCLDCLVAQNYDPGKLQCIVVDDRSEDRTPEILREYAEKWPALFQPLYLTETAPGFSPKKFALSRGLEYAKGEIIVTTDADCIMSSDWVKTLAGEFSEDTGLVLGMTSYYPIGPETQRWGIGALEFLSYGVVAAALIGLRFPVHGNANNIAYRRKVYDRSTGFAGHGNIVSGDDDFLIQSIHKLGAWSIRYSVHSESQVRTEPPLDLGQFWEQRKRWASKCSLYQPKQVAFLGSIFAYYALILVCLVVGIFRMDYLLLGLIAWSVKTGSDYLVMRKGTDLFAKRELMRFFPLASLLHIPLIIAAVVAGSFGGFTWKGQKHRKKVAADRSAGEAARAQGSRAG